MQQYLRFKQKNALHSFSERRALISSELYGRSLSHNLPHRGGSLDRKTEARRRVAKLHIHVDSLIELEAIARSSRYQGQLRGFFKVEFHGNHACSFRAHVCLTHVAQAVRHPFACFKADGQVKLAELEQADVVFLKQHGLWFNVEQLKEIRAFLAKFDSLSFVRHNGHLIDVGTAVINHGTDFEFELGRRGNDELCAILRRDPIIIAGKQNSHFASHDFHDLGFFGAEFVVAGQHNTESFYGTIGKGNSAAGDLAIKIDIGLFCDCDIAEFGHIHSLFPCMFPRCNHPLVRGRNQGILSGTKHRQPNEDNQMNKISFGILSTAKIGMTKVTPAMQNSEFTEVTAICSRSEESARKAADELGIPKAYGSYEALLADKDIDAVYIPLPNHMHVQWAINAMKAGKHVLCEKPIGLNTDEANSLIDATSRYPDVKVMEAFMFRHHPQWIEAKRLVDDEIGRAHV